MASVAGHQINHLPYSGYFAKMACVDQFVLVDTTQYVKKEYHNRNRILIRNSGARWLTVPVVTHGRFHQLLNEVEIDTRSNWQRQHIRAIEVNYATAPYFRDMFSKLSTIYTETEWHRLADFNIALIRLIRDILKITTPIRLSSELGATGKATDLIADMCRRTHADTYLHGRHAVDYVAFETLSNHGIRSLIQTFDSTPYPQQNPGFTPNLSVIDLIFNCGPASLEILMSGNIVAAHCEA